MKRSWAKGQAAIVNALKRNTAFATKHGNAFNKIKLKSGDTDAAEWLKFQAFTTAVVEDEKLRLKIKKGIAQALERGETKKQFLNSLPKVLNEFKSKLKTTFETNQALAFGAAQQAKLIEVSEDFPYWKYSALHDSHTRPDHLALDGKIFESTDHRFYPPISYNCRCTAIPLTAAQAGRTDQNQFMHPKQELKQPIASAEFVGNKQKNFVKWLEKRAATAEPQTKALIEKAVERLVRQNGQFVAQARKQARPEIKKSIGQKDFKTPDDINFKLSNQDIEEVISHGHTDLLGMLDVLRNLEKTISKSTFAHEAPNSEPNNPKKKDVLKFRYYNYQNNYFFTFKAMRNGNLKLYAISNEISKKGQLPTL